MSGCPADEYRSSPVSRVEDAQEEGDEAGQLLLDEQRIGAPEYFVGPKRLMDEGVNDVLDEGGGTGRLDAVPGHITDENGDLVVFDLEDIIEITAHAGRLRGRAVEMPETDRAELRGDVKQRGLQVLRNVELLAVKALVLLRQDPEALLGLLALGNILGDTESASYPALCVSNNLARDSADMTNRPIGPDDPIVDSAQLSLEAHRLHVLPVPIQVVRMDHAPNIVHEGRGPGLQTVDPIVLVRGFERSCIPIDCPTSEMTDLLGLLEYRKVLAEGLLGLLALSEVAVDHLVRQSAPELYP